MKALILEDDEGRIQAFRSRFEEYAARKDTKVLTHFVEHAQDAIDAIQKVEFDIIFLDHDLGGKQIDFDEEDCGRLVTEFITTHPKEVLGNPQIIIHTLNSSAGDRMEKDFTSSDFIAENEDERFNVFRIPFIWVEGIFAQRMF